MCQRDTMVEWLERSPLVLRVHGSKHSWWTRAFHNSHCSFSKNGYPTRLWDHEWDRDWLRHCHSTSITQWVSHWASQCVNGQPFNVLQEWMNWMSRVTATVTHCDCEFASEIVTDSVTTHCHSTSITQWISHWVSQCVNGQPFKSTCWLLGVALALLLLCWWVIELEVGHSLTGCHTHSVTVTLSHYHTHVAVTTHVTATTHSVSQSATLTQSLSLCVSVCQSLTAQCQRNLDFCA